MTADTTGRVRPTARQRARAEITGEIKDEARRQLATTGAQLSLRAVARELGMVSSALYRYFPSRDDLLTALIIDAYDALATAAQACCHAIRGWALAHPHEYSLIYGSPVPGYHAPQDTTAHAARVAAVLGGLLAGAHQHDGGPASAVLPGQLAAQGELVAAAVAPGVTPDIAARGLVAWTQLFGMISFELFGQLVGTADPADDFFAYAIDLTATVVGLPEA
jgi:AcrR family transcriptional regulator